ncbi:hypothetical protein DPMN_174127 [Dreissena polymorpha]|uniref:Uncharacterized protein n=1 Tax=Dreissena polymorpha TaxID=45954 RepID=A0A9D4E5P4_DREPO|nr:hypothetical protein DPMN_174127 [Dreissena polymorpha]
MRHNPGEFSDLYKVKSRERVAMAQWIWCLSSDREVTGSIPTMGAFLRYVPKDTKYWFCPETDFNKPYVFDAIEQ